MKNRSYITKPMLPFAAIIISIFIFSAAVEAATLTVTNTGNSGTELVNEPVDTDGDGVPDELDNCPTTPNPEKIAFSTFEYGDEDIYVMNAADGSGRTNLTNNDAEDREPAISPNGSRIAFVSNRDGNYEIYIMNADGSGQIRLTDNEAADTEPVFSPDGTKVAFRSNRDGNLNPEIYVMNVDGSGQTRLTNDPALDFDPFFSPDGSKITFTSNRDGDSDIYVMNADGTGVIKLTNNDVSDFVSEFSPDGSKIVFTSRRDGINQIYVMNADGTGQVNLSNNVYEDLWATFSPDGSKIAFTTGRDGGASEIYVMNADGTGQVNRSNNPAADVFPSWGSQADSDGDGIGDACGNTAPTITASVGVTRQQAAGSSNSSIATLVDAEDAEQTLSVTVNDAANATVNGVTISNIAVDAAGNVTADVSAACAASGAAFTLKVTDSGGLTATATLNVTVTNETTPPVIEPIADVTVYLPLNSPALSRAVTFPLPTATDNCTASPVVTTSPVSGSVFNVGTTTVNVTAKDELNNTANATFKVNVLFNFAGFFQPVDAFPMVNKASAGQSIPVKFSLSGNKGLAILAAGYPKSSPVPCSQNEPGDEIEETSSSRGASLTYSAGSDQYTYIWKTDKSWKLTCRVLVVKLIDGTEHYAKFSFR